MMRKLPLIIITCLAALTLLIGCEKKESKQGTTVELTDAQGNNAIDWEYQITYQRGVEAVAWAGPAVSMMKLRDANFGLGGSYNSVYYMGSPPNAKSEALTANNQTPYATIHLTTKNGPVVLDVPPATERTAIFGSAVNVWQEPVADIGPAGTDQGRGGRYLFLPPSYEGNLPEGFFVVRMDTYGVYVALRCIPLGGSSFQESAEYAKKINAYALSEADAPPPGDYINQYDRYMPTLPDYDLSYFNYIAELIDEEPLFERDKVMGGMLASIGIQKGIAFDPKDVVKKALEDAVRDGRYYLEYMFETPGYSLENYYMGRQWQQIRQPSVDGFVFDEGDYLLLDPRSSLFHWATFVPRRLGKATAYLLGLRDANGNTLRGDGVYKLTVPANVPAQDFWSAIAYNRVTKAWIYNDINRLGLSSYDLGKMKGNADGSVDIYFSQSAPEGLESNWVPTGGKDFFILFRFYGPEEAYFDKSFVLPDIVKIEPQASTRPGSH